MDRAFSAYFLEESLHWGVASGWYGSGLRPSTYAIINDAMYSDR